MVRCNEASKRACATRNSTGELRQRSLPVARALLGVYSVSFLKLISSDNMREQHSYQASSPAEHTLWEQNDAKKSAKDIGPGNKPVTDPQRLGFQRREIAQMEIAEEAAGMAGTASGRVCPSGRPVSPRTRLFRLIELLFQVTEQ